MGRLLTSVSCVFLLLSSAMTLAAPSAPVLYGVVPPLFGEEPLRAVTEKLPYLQAQGANVLWLAPVQKTDDPSQISYAITDYLGLRDDYGTSEDLRELVRHAHALQMKVILDFVPNHVSTAHPWHVDAEARRNLSPFFGYFDRDPQGRVIHFFDWEHLANLNHRAMPVRRHLHEAFEYWVREYDIDGYRMDAAWGVQEREPGFWPEAIGRLRAIKPDFLLLAEASARHPAYRAAGFDWTYDWTQKPGEWAWSQAFENRKQARRHLQEALSYANGADVVRFLNNNDTGERFIARYGEPLTRVAAALQYTVPGVPLLFTGDEFGAQYDPYADDGPLDWPDERDPRGLQCWYQKLARLRETVPSLVQGRYTSLGIRGPETVHAFARVHGREQACVVLNFGDQSEVVELQGCEGRPSEVLRSGAVLSVAFRPDGWLKLKLKAFGAAVFVTNGN